MSLRREIEATLERGRERYGRKLLGCIKDVIECYEGMNEARFLYIPYLTWGKTAKIQYYTYSPEKRSLDG